MPGFARRKPRSEKFLFLMRISRYENRNCQNNRIPSGICVFGHVLARKP